jgi:hypothetical protein
LAVSNTMFSSLHIWKKVVYCTFASPG